MRRIYYVDMDMCGGDELPAGFDLEEFCERLQGKLTDIEIIPVTDDPVTAYNPNPRLVSDRVFREALGEYLPTIA